MARPSTTLRAHAAHALPLALALLVLASPAAQADTISFVGIEASTSKESIVRASTQAVINGRVTNIQWRPVLESGKTYPGFAPGTTWEAGTVLDKNGVALTAADDPRADPAGARDFDRTTIMVKFDRIWMITQNEEDFGNYFLCELEQDRVTGVLSVVKARSLNLGSIYGTIDPCSGSITPWTTHLGSEEESIDAKGWPPSDADDKITAMQVVNRLPNWEDVNPYWYGWITEISVTSAAGDYWVKKRFAVGRGSWENCITLSDSRTLICAEDSREGGVVTMFVADRARDLTSGKLYAMKPTQLNPADGGSFQVEWVPLNNGVSVQEAAVAAAVANISTGANVIKFSDLFEEATVVVTGGSPDLTQMPLGFREVRVGERYEWLKLRPGRQALASVLETTRMAAYLGATTEWTKAEGLAWDWDNHVLYMAISSIEGPMLDNPDANSEDLEERLDGGGINAIRVPENKGGAIFRLSTRATSLSQYTPDSAQAVLTSWGGLDADDDEDFSVPAGAIAGPDNIGMMTRYGMLVIGEDCGQQHPNNFMWAYNLKTRQLTRILSAPEEAEVTSTYYFSNIKRFSYLTATIQSPREEDMPATVGYWVLPKLT